MNSKLSQDFYQARKRQDLRTRYGLNVYVHASPGREVPLANVIQTRNRKHRRAAAKPAACTKPLMLSTLGSTGKRGGGEVGKEEVGL